MVIERLMMSSGAGTLRRGLANRRSRLHAAGGTRHCGSRRFRLLFPALAKSNACPDLVARGSNAAAALVSERGCEPFGAGDQQALA
jgi:hypothetical protein